MRLSSFVPINMPIAFGMIITAPTPFNTILWQWLNQTYNAALNYGNRNASSNYTEKDIAKSYGAACASSIGVALGVRKALESKTRHMKGAKLVIFNSISAFFACSTAGFLNAYFMR
jgi:sideroflexin-5